MFNNVALYQSSMDSYGENLTESDVHEELDHHVTPEDSNDFPAKKKSQSYVHMTMYLVAFISTAFLATVAYNSVYGDVSVSSLYYISSRAASYSLSVKVTSGTYGELDSLTYLPWDAIVEPHRDQIFSIDSLVIDDVSVNVTDADYTVTWDIAGNTYTGTSVTAMVDSVGVYDATVTVTPMASSANHGKRWLAGESRTTPKYKIYKQLAGKVYKPHESSSYELTFSMAVKYVRREIRSLSDTDRTDYFDALKVLYTMGEADGQSLFGPKFHSAETLAAMHLLGGAKTDCDHFHDGAAIATSHIAMTLFFEQSMQAVNPKIALPYWEYTLDNYLYGSSSESVIWGSDWFGSMSSGNSDHTIDDNSFWANVSIPDGTQYQDWDIASTGSLNPYVNAYNQLRSPWNNDATNKILRSNTVYGGEAYTGYPTCSTLLTAFDQDSISNINWYLNGGTHGPTHIYIGGAWVDDDSLDDYPELKDADKILFFKILWRMGYTRCPSSCSDDDDDCKCSVPDEYIEKYGAKAILEAATITDRINLNLDKNGTSSYYLGYLRALEDPGNAGEMFSSNAAYDPVFWSVHGTMERLVGLKRIAYQQGDIDTFDETWGYTSYDSTSGDAYLEGVCDWSNVTSTDDLTLPTCDTSASCYGHGANDTVPFNNFLDIGDSYTNTEFYDFINPWTDDLPYVFDTYLYDYCSEYDNVDFMTTTSSSKLEYKGYKHKLY